MKMIESQHFKPFYTGAMLHKRFNQLAIKLSFQYQSAIFGIHDFVLKNYIPFSPL